MAIERTATAQWQGDAVKGSGNMSIQNGAISDVRFSVASRFEGAAGTNSEELIAAALVNCFCTVLVMLLTEAGFVSELIEVTEVTATVTLVQETSTISEANLTLFASVPGIDKKIFDEIIQDAGEISPIIKLLNTKITLDYQLAGYEIE